MKQKNINNEPTTTQPVPPQATVRRLSIYLRCLSSLEETGVQMVSSHEIASFLELNPAQVRKDLAYFGEFGKRGVGYSVSRLRDHIMEILGLKKKRMVGIIGAGGHLGHALSMYKGFEKRNFKVVALFDKDPQTIGQIAKDIGPIKPMDELTKVVKELGIEMLILTVPADAARSVFDSVVLSGVKAVLNFSPVNLSSTAEVCVHNVDLAVELEYLTFHLNRNQGN
ncbi:MAG: redox-sensing transcriptional repressor Rex [Candidatus Riflebacteria bacterium]|nr:redox-sensing transcriptional repressor Rex [Candidatus Riflebacteria bacterium]